MTTVDSWPKTLPKMSVGSWNSTTETHLVHRFNSNLNFETLYYSSWNVKENKRCFLQPALTQNCSLCFHFPLISNFECGIARESRILFLVSDDCKGSSVVKKFNMTQKNMPNHCPEHKIWSFINLIHWSKIRQDRES